MKRLLKSALGLVLPNSEWLVLLAVAAIGAWFYVDAARARSDRDDAVHRAELICAAAGAHFEATRDQVKDAQGRAGILNHARGATCQRLVADLVTFKSRTDQQTAAVLAQAIRDHDARQSKDNLAARAAADAARAATERMEAADAEAERKDLVDREWFAAVNGVAGLRPPTR